MRWIVDRGPWSPGCASGSAVVEAVGQHIAADMASYWQADDAFFDLLRAKEVLTAIVQDVAGDKIAAANVNEKGKALKTVIRNHLDGADGRVKVEHWVPRWMIFPPSTYTARGGVASVAASAELDDARNDNQPEPPDTSPSAAVGPMPLAA